MEDTTQATKTDDATQMPPQDATLVKRGRGRPKGSKNKPKTAQT